MKICSEYISFGGQLPMNVYVWTVFLANVNNVRLGPFHIWLGSVESFTYLAVIFIQNTKKKKNKKHNEQYHVIELIVDAIKNCGMF